MFFVRSSAPVSVAILDTDGNRAGPVSVDSLGVIDYEVPNIGYWASKLSTVVSAPANNAYTIQVFSTGEDMLGRSVAVLVDAIKAPGVHYVQFNAANLPSGLYLYHLEAGTYNQTQTMIRMK